MTNANANANARARVGREKQRYNDARQRLVAGCICVRDERDGREDASKDDCEDDDDDGGEHDGEEDGERARGDANEKARARSEARTTTRVRVLMINSKRGPRGRDSERDLIFPKGGWETDESAAEAAARESMEEGGVRGEISRGAPTIAYEFTSRSKIKSGCDPIEAKCIAHVFTMHVTEVLEHWPEEGERTRYWLSPRDAWLRCKHDWMRDALVACGELGLRAEEFDSSPRASDENDTDG